MNGFVKIESSLVSNCQNMNAKIKNIKLPEDEASFAGLIDRKPEREELYFGVQK